jgi:hypothetical protein
MAHDLERRALQIAVTIAGLVPLTAGALGVIDPGVLGLYGDRNAISHASYLSGLLLGIGLGYWSLIPDIEKRSGSFTLLTAIVQAGGRARLYATFRMGTLSLGILVPLVMELVVTPLLWMWQQRVSHRAQRAGASRSASK